MAVHGCAALSQRLSALGPRPASAPAALEFRMQAVSGTAELAQAEEQARPAPEGRGDHCPGSWLPLGNYLFWG